MPLLGTPQDFLFFWFTCFKTLGLISPGTLVEYISNEHYKCPNNFGALAPFWDSGEE